MNYPNRHGAPYSLLLAALLAAFAPPAHAYLDPGTGSMIVQGLIAGIAAAFFALKLYWYRVKRFFFPDKRADSEATEDGSDDERS